MNRADAREYDPPSPNPGRRSGCLPRAALVAALAALAALALVRRR